ncbi:hypothetical protein Ahia01_000606200 [Argonauta hians]
MDLPRLPWVNLHLSDLFETNFHKIRFEAPMPFIADFLQAVLEIIVNLRSEGRRVEGESHFTTRSLDKRTKRKVIPPTTVNYVAIANDCLSSYYELYAKEVKENMVADGMVNEDIIYLNFYTSDGENDTKHVWETWGIQVCINPARTYDESESSLTYLKSAINRNTLRPLSNAISLEECKRIFDCNQGHNWPYRNFLQQGSKFPSDHVLRVNTNLKNLNKILFIIFETILYYRCTARLESSKNIYKIRERPFTTETVSEFGISYPRIHCNDLREYLETRANYCLKCVQKVYFFKEFTTFYLSFYQLNMDHMITTRKICERWQIVCQMKPDLSSEASSNLSQVLSYIKQTKFPVSLRVSPTLKYVKLYRYYFTGMAACTPPRFYIHS